MNAVFRYALVGLILILPACTDVKKSEEYQRVSSDRDSLIEMVMAREQEIQEFSKEFDQIEKNLSAIDTNKARLLALSAKGKMIRKDRIHNLIADIYIALDENRLIIHRLESQISKGSNAQGLKNIITSLKGTLEAKEIEIKALGFELSNLQLQVKNLKDAVAYKESQLAERDTLLAKKEEKIHQQEKIIEEKETELTKAFYIRGTSKELAKAGIVKKEGGLAGLGSVKVLGEKMGGEKVKNINTKTDKMILVGRYKKKKVISTHPSDSYFFIAREGQIYIKISFPDKFWSISKYLVVEVE